MQFTAIDRNGNQHELQGSTGQSLMEVLRDAGLEVEAVCGGCCACATCHVFIESRWQVHLLPRGSMETELLTLSEAFDPERSRLSCQIECTNELNGLAVTLAPEE